MGGGNFRASILGASSEHLGWEGRPTCVWRKQGAQSSCFAASIYVLEMMIALLTYIYMLRRPGTENWFRGCLAFGCAVDRIWWKQVRNKFCHSCEYLRVALTQKIVHARSGELFKRYGAIFKSQLKTLLDFRTAFKSTAAAGTRSSSKSHAYSSSVVAVDRNADDNDYEESWYGCHLLLKSVICNNWRQECVTFYKYVENIP